MDSAPLAEWESKHPYTSQPVLDTCRVETEKQETCWELQVGTRHGTVYPSRPEV